MFLVRHVNDSSKPILSTLGIRTAGRIIEALESGDSLAVSRILQPLQEITSNADRISVCQLADVVSRDLSILARVLAVANTIGCNPTGVHITTVHQAIQVIGFEKVRNIAIASMLLVGTEQAGNELIKQRVAAGDLASGTIAQATLEKKSSCPTEEAFVVSSLRKYGELLITQFLPVELHQAKSLAARLGWDEACQTVFGLTALDLGRAVLAHSSRPQPPHPAKQP